MTSVTNRSFAHVRRSSTMQALPVSMPKSLASSAVAKAALMVCSASVQGTCCNSHELGGLSSKLSLAASNPAKVAIIPIPGPRAKKAGAVERHDPFRPAIVKVRDDVRI